MNSDRNCAWVDEHARIHFVTWYLTYCAQELVARFLDRFIKVLPGVGTSIAVFNLNINAKKK